MNTSEERSIYAITNVGYEEMSQFIRTYDDKYPHLVTVRTLHWLPLFLRDDYYTVLTESLEECVRFRGVYLHAYVLMPNHFHILCSQKGSSLLETIHELKADTSRRILPMLGSDGKEEWLKIIRRVAGDSRDPQIWQEDIFLEELRCQYLYDQKIELIHSNPERIGLVSSGTDWPHSSAGFYMCDRISPVRITKLRWR
jgi:putative transposase